MNVRTAATAHTHTHTAEYGHAHNPIDKDKMWKTTEWYVMFSYWPWAVGSQGGRARMKGDVLSVASPCSYRPAPGGGLTGPGIAVSSLAPLTTPRPPPARTASHLQRHTLCS